MGRCLGRVGRRRKKKKMSFNKNNTPMRYNNLGGTGLIVSEFSFGCMTFSNGHGTAGNVQTPEAYKLMKTCFENGINFFDNAEAYGGPGTSEIIMGEAVQLGLKDGVWGRDIPAPPRRPQKS